MIVTRDVESRYRGFLASAMLEIAPGVYVSPFLSSAVRNRIWDVMEDWYAFLGQGSVSMVWKDKKMPGGLGLLFLGDPPKEIVNADGVLLVKRPVPRDSP